MYLCSFFLHFLVPFFFTFKLINYKIDKRTFSVRSVLHTELLGQQQFTLAVGSSIIASVLWENNSQYSIESKEKNELIFQSLLMCSETWYDKTISLPCPTFWLGFLGFLQLFQGLPLCLSSLPLFEGCHYRFHNVKNAQYKTWALVGSEQTGNCPLPTKLVIYSFRINNYITTSCCSEILTLLTYIYQSPSKKKKNQKSV